MRPAARFAAKIGRRRIAAADLACQLILLRKRMNPFTTWKMLPARIGCLLAVAFGSSSAVTFAAESAAADSEDGAARRPNVVVILTDEK